MAKFNIEIQEYLARVIEIEADNADDAISMVKEQHKKAKIILDSNDFVEVNFIDIDAMNETDELKILTTAVIEYLWQDEEKHYEESENATDHIFLKLKRLKALIG